MKKLVLGVVLLFSVAAVKAQSMGQTYQTALGVKVWDGGGVSLKHFFRENRAGEFIAYFWRDGFRLTGLYEIHGDINGAAGLKWYIGPGAHIGVYGDKYGDGAFIGIDGVIGLDYKFNGAPINVSLDWQPAIEFGDGRGFYAGWGGLGIRYTF